MCDSRHTSGSRRLCRSIWRYLWFEDRINWYTKLTASVSISLETPWVQRHILTCRRCRTRFGGVAKVLLALQAIRTQAMDIHLLQKANAAAIGTLHRSVRDVPKARALRQAVTAPSLGYRLGQSKRAIAQMAACIAITVLGRAGMLSSFKSAQQMGTRAMNHCYAKSLGQDLADRLYPRS